MLDRLTTVVRGWRQRWQAAREMDDELAFHVEMEMRANVERGLSRSYARRVALHVLGGVECPSIATAVSAVTGWRLRLRLGQL